MTRTGQNFLKGKTAGSMAKSGKEAEKSTGKDGAKGADTPKTDSETKAKEAPPKPVDPVTACLNGKYRSKFESQYACG